MTYSQDDLPSYLVLGPVGEEDGPYTVEDLRHRLSKGRLRREDRLRDRQRGIVLTVESLIPDAAKFEDEGRAEARRLRRTSEERRAAAEAAAGEVTPGKNTPDGPPPGLVTAPVLVDPSVPSRRRWGGLALAGGVALVLGVAWTFLPERVPPHLDLQALEGHWRLNEVALRDAVKTMGEGSVQAHFQGSADRVVKQLGGVTLRLQDQLMTIEMPGTRTTHICTVVGGDAGGVGIQMAPGHPILGSEMAFFVREEGVVLQTAISELQIPLMAVPAP